MLIFCPIKLPMFFTRTSINVFETTHICFISSFVYVCFYPFLLLTLTDLTATTEGVFFLGVVVLFLLEVAISVDWLWVFGFCYSVHEKKYIYFFLFYYILFYSCVLSSNQCTNLRVLICSGRHFCLHLIGLCLYELLCGTLALS